MPKFHGSLGIVRFRFVNEPFLIHEVTFNKIPKIWGKIVNCEVLIANEGMLK